MSISARQWNELGAELRQARAISGMNTRVGPSELGQLVSAQSGEQWRHPWSIRARWDAAAKAWTATVLAGFVNGQAPIVQMTAATAPDATMARLAAMKKATGPATLAVQAPLYDGPALGVPWMALGIDGDASDAVPKYFLDRGVSEAAAVSEDDIDGGAGTIVAPKGNRLLRKCDVVLHQPRYGLKADVQVGDGLATGQATTIVTLNLTPVDPGDALRVYSISQWVSAEGEPDPVTGAYAEPNYDEVVIGTVYMLSQPDAALYSSPDATWEWYAAHNLYWNLSYAQPVFAPVATDIGDPLLVPLAGGVAQSIVNEFTSLASDAMNEALEYVGEQSMQGSFWSVTGGGSDSRMPAAAAMPAQGNTGLDKDGRLQEERAQAQAALLAETLDPGFPYYSTEFNLNLLNR